MLPAVLQSSNPTMDEVMRYINQHSFTLTAAALLLVVAGLVLRRGLTLPAVTAVVALAAGLTLAHYLLSPGPSTVGEAQAVLDRIGAGRPVLLEFQSPY